MSRVQHPKCEGQVYREYDSPGGKIRLTRTEFEALVEHFRILARWRDDAKEKSQDLQREVSNQTELAS